MSSIEGNNSNPHHLTMQQRRGGAITGSKTVPSGNSEGETDALEVSQSLKYHNGGGGGSTSCGPRFWSVLTLAVMSLLLVTCIQQFSENQELKQQPERVLALSAFPTLSWALDHADLVGLYFAAQWCPMSTPVTQKLGQHFPDSVLLPPPTQNTNPSHHTFAIVYVSSDTTQEEMNQYVKPNWIAIPMEEDERTALKKHFAVCAKRELEELDMERKFEIPSLFILDGATQGLITTNGAQDVLNRGAVVLEYWKELQLKIRDMEQRFRHY